MTDPNVTATRVHQRLLHATPYFGLWDTQDKAGMAKEFDIDPESIADIEVLFALYTCHSYSGEVWVLFERDGTLYEVNGGHCSCYGLEGQWDPEETTLDALRHRFTVGREGNHLHDLDADEQEVAARLLVAMLDCDVKVEGRYGGPTLIYHPEGKQ